MKRKKQPNHEQSPNSLSVPSHCHVTNLRNCVGWINTILQKDIPLVGVLKMVMGRSIILHLCSIEIW